MNCEHTRPLLADYSAGLLGRTQHESVVAHLQQCSACQEELERWQRLDGLARTESGPNSEALVLAVMVQVRTEQRRRLPGWLRMLDAGAAPLAVAFLTGGLLFGFWQRLSSLLPAATAAESLGTMLPALSLAMVAGGVTAVAGWYVSRLVTEGA